MVLQKEDQPGFGKEFLLESDEWKNSNNLAEHKLPTSRFIVFVLAFDIWISIIWERSLNRPFALTAFCASFSKAKLTNAL